MMGQKLALQRYAAPWGRMLKGSSVVVLLLFMVFGFIGQTGGAAMFWPFPLLLLLALPFVVRGYTISGEWLMINRLGWDNRFPLAELQSAEFDPHVMKQSIRLFGNGGIFSFTGLYRNKKLGNYRCFVNDLKKTVVLRFEKRTIVVSPDNPEAFLAAIKGLIAEQSVT